MLRLIEQLDPHYEVHVIGPSGAETALPHDVQLYGLSPRFLAWFLLGAWCKTLLLNRKHRFSAVIAGNGLMTTAATATVFGTHTPILTLLHGLDIVVDNQIYQGLVLPLIRRSQGVVANSANTARLAIEYGVSGEHVTVLNPGVTLPSQEPDRNFRHQFGLQDRKILLSVGRIVKRKGLAAFVDNALPGIVEQHADAILVIAGDKPDAALKREDAEAAAVLAAAENHGLKDKVLFLGRVDDQTLGAAYSSADVHIFPVRDVIGDVEGFGMVALEAAAHGLPTVGFRVGGVVDAVLDGQTGCLVTPGQYDQLVDAVVSLLNTTDRPRIQEQCRKYAASCSWEKYGAGVMDIIQTCQI